MPLGKIVPNTTSASGKLFAGEQFDENLDQYYLRARYYDQKVGRFTQMDSYQGNNSDPVSLHKYLYANADPVMYTDPSGYFVGGLSSLSVASGIFNTLAIGVVYSNQLLSALRPLADPSAALDTNRQRTAVDVAIGTYQVRTCQRSGNADCEANIPVIIYGGDLWDLTNHIYDAQNEMGMSPVLRRKSPGWGRDWLRSRSECLGRGRSQQCDEYPFNSSKEGGPNNNVSLRLINGIHNESGGTKLNSLYTECDVKASDPVKQWFGVIAIPGGPATRPVCGVGR